MQKYDPQNSLWSKMCEVFKVWAKFTLFYNFELDMISNFKTDLLGHARASKIKHQVYKISYQLI